MLDRVVAPPTANVPSASIPEEVIAVFTELVPTVIVVVDKPTFAPTFNLLDTFAIPVIAAPLVAVNNPEITFDLTAQGLNEVVKATAILQLDKINVVSSNGDVSVVVADPKNPSSNKFSLKVNGTSTADLAMAFAAENLKVIAGDYKVNISSNGISSFKNEKLNLEYFVAADVKQKKA